jgi:hypothetical protein
MIFAREVHAGQVIYSWQGMVTQGFNAPDPWSIGESGKPFALSVVVDAQAVDQQADAEHAYFVPTSIAFSIDGVDASAIDIQPSGPDFDWIAFDDDLFSGAVDQMAIKFTAEFSAVAIPFYASVRLPASTFSHSLGNDSPPPVFGTAIASEDAAFGSSYYSGGSAAGTPVHSALVPEPHAAALGATALIGLSAIAWLRRRRRVS